MSTLRKQEDPARVAAADFFGAMMTWINQPERSLEDEHLNEPFYADYLAAKKKLLATPPMTVAGAGALAKAIAIGIASEVMDEEEAAPVLALVGDLLAPNFPNRTSAHAMAAE